MKEVYIIIIYSITHSSRRSIIKEDHHINLQEKALQSKSNGATSINIQFTRSYTRQDLQDVFPNIQDTYLVFIIKSNHIEYIITS